MGLPQLIIPARIFFLVSIYRCLFPVNYIGNIIFHSSFFSSIFLTRLFATCSEIAMIFQISYLIRLFNVNNIYLIDVLSSLMVVLVVFSQFFVWVAILKRKSIYYFYEEIGWFIIYAINTTVSIYLYFQLYLLNSVHLLIVLNILFGFFYLPWQILHLNYLRKNIREVNENNFNRITYKLSTGLFNSLTSKNISVKLEDWGGFIGMTWMTAYWATIMPLWIYVIVSLY